MANNIANELELARFYRSLGTSSEQYEAMRTIKDLAKHNKLIHPSLLPYLYKACDAWAKQPPYDKWDRLVKDVRLVFRLGETLDNAVRQVAESNCVSESTLRAKYKKNEHTDAKNEADWIYEDTKHLFKPKE